jgi:hypothetical protein
MRQSGLLVTAAVLAGFAVWAAVAWMVARAMSRLADSVDPHAPPFLTQEAWVAIASSGAAAGAVLGFSTVAPSVWLDGAHRGLLLLSLVTAGSMVLGAALTGLLALVAVWLRLEL